MFFQLVSILLLAIIGPPILQDTIGEHHVPISVLDVPNGILGGAVLAREIQAGRYLRIEN